MKTSKAEVKTDKAVSYMKQLCRHWEHKFNVVFDDEAGRIELLTSVCLLKPSAQSLAVELEMPEDVDQSRMETVVAEHLQRFGFKETLVFDWARNAAASAS